MTYTPTEQANIAATREIVATGNRQDWDACYALVAPNCICHIGPLTLRGQSEMRAYDAKFFPRFSSNQRRILDISADGDTVVFRWRTDAVLAATGEEVSFEGCSWSRLENRKTVESWIYTANTQA